MSPDRGHTSFLPLLDSPSSIAPLLVMSKSGVHQSSIMAQLEDKPANDTPPSPPTRPYSLHSSSVHSLQSDQSRRDSGYSSSKPASKRHRGSRSSSKQSLSSSRDISGDDARNTGAAKRPARPRVTSISRKSKGVEEALALHERSKLLFGPASRPATSSGEPPGLVRGISLPAGFENTVEKAVLQRMQTLPPPMPGKFEEAVNGEVKEDEVEEVHQTIIHWTSEETRRREYAAIDRRTKGVRGWWNRVLVRFRKSRAVRFYDERDGDEGSVRRYRMDLDEK